MPFHSALTGSELHEPKGVAAAAAGKVYVTDGLGSGSFEDHLEIGDITVSGSNSEELTASATATQNPSTTDDTLQVTFGVAVNTGADPVSSDVSGNITFNESGPYRVDCVLQVGRTAGAADALIHARALLNGTPLGATKSVYLEDANIISPLEFHFAGEFSATEILTFEIVRDPAEDDSGGLVPGVSTATGWTSSPSATVSIGRIEYAV